MENKSIFYYVLKIFRQGQEDSRYPPYPLPGLPERLSHSTRRWLTIRKIRYRKSIYLDNVQATLWFNVFFDLLLSTTPFSIPKMFSQQTNRVPHPLEQLSIDETHQAREIVLAVHKNSIVDFRAIFLEEPIKSEL